MASVSSVSAATAGQLSEQYLDSSVEYHGEYVLLEKFTLPSLNHCSVELLIGSLRFHSAQPLRGHDSHTYTTT